MRKGQPKILWPEEVKAQAVAAYLAGRSSRAVAAEVARLTGRECHKTNVEKWAQRTGAERTPALLPAWVEVLELLKASPLSAQEIAEIRGVGTNALLMRKLERDGYVRRAGGTRKVACVRSGRQTLFHWTGKPFPTPLHDMDAQVQQALAFQAKCEYRLSLIAQEQEHAS